MEMMAVPKSFLREAHDSSAHSSRPPLTRGRRRSQCGRMHTYPWRLRDQVGFVNDSDRSKYTKPIVVRILGCNAPVKPEREVIADPAVSGESDPARS